MTSLPPPRDALQPEMDEPEISLYDLMEFVRTHARNLLMGVTGGLVLGALGGWSTSGYRAEIVLDNSITAQSQSQSQIGYSEWNTLIQALPALATQAIEQQRSEGREGRDLQFLANAKWWANHVKTVLAVDKNTSKELGAMPDNLKSEVGRILQIRISAEADKKTQALNRTQGALSFIRSAGIYLKAGALIDGMRVDSMLARQDFETRREENKIEVAYLDRDVINLQSLINFNTHEITERIALMNRVSNETQSDGPRTRSIFNIRGGDAPDIPLDARLNELKLALHQKEIERLRIRDQEAQNQLVEAFLVLAEPLKQESSVLTGEALINGLLEVEAQLRNQGAADDPVRNAKLNQIRSNLNRIQIQMVNQLPVISSVVERESRLLKGLLAGGFGGLLLALTGSVLLAVYRSGKVKTRIKPLSD